MATSTPKTKAPKEVMPGEKGATEKPRKVRPVYDGSAKRSEDGKFLIELPTDFDEKHYLPLRKTDFASAVLYADWKVVLAEKALERAKANAAEARTGGSASEKMKKKRFMKMAQEAAQLKAELEAMGINIEELQREVLAGATSENSEG